MLTIRQARHALFMWSGAAVAYVAMAACGSSGDGGFAGTPQGPGGDVADGGPGPSGSTKPGSLDPVPPAKAEPKSGSRLKARYEVGSDGARQFVGWRDSKLGINCTFQWTSEKKRRCLPVDRNAPQTTIFSTADDCRQSRSPIPAIAANKCLVQEDNGYVVDWQGKISGKCGEDQGITKVYRLGTAKPATTKAYQLYSCGELNLATTEYALYSYSEVALGEFVEGTEQIDP